MLTERLSIALQPLNQTSSNAVHILVTVYGDLSTQRELCPVMLVMWTNRITPTLIVLAICFFLFEIPRRESLNSSVTLEKQLDDMNHQGSLCKLEKM